ncbi:hypothetical protein P7C70_g6107, partial [Phenoliferia sp. Uapishka_3]
MSGEDRLELGTPSAEFGTATNLKVERDLLCRLDSRERKFFFLRARHEKRSMVPGRYLSAYFRCADQARAIQGSRYDNPKAQEATWGFAAVVASGGVQYASPTTRTGFEGLRGSWQEICPDGTLPPLGRTSRVKVEREELAFRVDKLEQIIVELGGSHRIPAALVFPPRPDIRDGADRTSSTDDENLLRAGVGSLTIDDQNGSVRFLGTSAASGYFASDDHSSSDTEDDHSRARSRSPISSFPYSPTESISSLDQKSSKSHEIEALRAMLPRREEGHRLADNYFETCIFASEPIQESQFFDEYLPHAYTPYDEQGSQLACVFLVLAVGLLFDRKAPATFNSQAHHYFLLSQACLAASRFLSSATIASAQALHLSGEYLFNSTHRVEENGEKYFPLLGIAIRQLVAMGLHRDGTLWGLSGVELDRRRLLFYELMSLDRHQAFMSGRPYMIQQAHFDTKMPANASEYQIWKWKLGIFLHSTILHLDQELRDIFIASPAKLRSRVLPASALAVRPLNPPTFPHPPSPASLPLHENLQNHTLDVHFVQILFYLHKPAFSQAIQEEAEPLQSPLAESVKAVVLETGPYILALARNWIEVDPVLCPRWWHIFFHAFAVSVSVSSLVVKCPTSILARHAWDQLNIAVEIFEIASRGGAPVAMLLPRVEMLREQAYASLQSSMGIPFAPRTEGPTAATISMLGPITRLFRKPKRNSIKPEDFEVPGPAYSLRKGSGQSDIDTLLPSVSRAYAPAQFLAQSQPQPQAPSQPPYNRSPLESSQGIRPSSVLLMHGGSSSVRSSPVQNARPTFISRPSSRPGSQQMIHQVQQNAYPYETGFAPPQEQTSNYHSPPSSRPTSSRRDNSAPPPAHGGSNGSEHSYQASSYSRSPQPSPPYPYQPQARNRDFSEGSPQIMSAGGTLTTAWEEQYPSENSGSWQPVDVEIGRQACELSHMSVFGAETNASSSSSRARIGANWVE